MTPTREATRAIISNAEIFSFIKSQAATAVKIGYRKMNTIDVEKVRYLRLMNIRLKDIVPKKHLRKSKHLIDGGTKKSDLSLIIIVSEQRRTTTMAQPVITSQTAISETK